MRSKNHNISVSKHPTHQIFLLLRCEGSYQQMINLQCIRRKSEHRPSPRQSYGGGWRKCQWCVSGVV